MTATPVETILCIYRGCSHEMNALEVAFDLAQRQNARLRVLHVSKPLIGVLDPFGATASSGAFLNETLIDQIENDHADGITLARSRVSDSASRRSVRVYDLERTFDASGGPSVLFLAREGEPQQVISLYGRSSDIIVITRQENDDWAGNGVLAALNTGKMVIVAPVADDRAINNFRPKRIVVAWDGSPQVQAALDSAIPLMTNVTSLHLLYVREPGRRLPKAHSAVTVRLRASGFDPVFLELDSPKKDVGQTILSTASDVKADLIILGAYGHNPFAEMRLGGTTRYILRHAPLTVLMSRATRGEKDLQIGSPK